MSIAFREVRSSGQSPIKKHGNNNDIKLFNAFKSRKRHDSFHHRKAGAKSIGLKKCLHMRDTVEKYLFFLTYVRKSHLEGSASTFLVLQLLVKTSHRKKSAVNLQYFWALKCFQNIAYTTFQKMKIEKSYRIVLLSSLKDWPSTTA